MVLVIPVVYSVLIYLIRPFMSLPTTSSKYGSLFFGIKNLNIWQVFYSVFFLIRRLTFIIVLTVL